MQLPLQVTFRHMDSSPAVEARIRERAERLVRLHDRITSVRVVVEAPHRRKRKGRLYHVGVDITVPGDEIAVTRKGPRDHAHEDVYVALRDAFDAAARRLEDRARKRRGEVKAHAVPPHGRIARLHAAEGYGFVETSDGLEVYFHRNSVADGRFDGLAEGDPVRLEIAEDESPDGPQATTVKPIGKHHLIG